MFIVSIKHCDISIIFTSKFGSLRLKAHWSITSETKQIQISRLPTYHIFTNIFQSQVKLSQDCVEIVKTASFAEGWSAFKEMVTNDYHLLVQLELALSSSPPPAHVYTFLLYTYLRM